MTLLTTVVVAWVAVGQARGRGRRWGRGCRRWGRGCRRWQRCTFTQLGRELVITIIPERYIEIRNGDVMRHSHVGFGQDWPDFFGGGPAGAALTLEAHEGFEVFIDLG